MPPKIFHIDGTPTPDVAVLYDPTEWRVAPLFSICGHHVDVGMDKECVGVTTRDSDFIVAAPLPRCHVLAGEPHFRKLVPNEVDDGIFRTTDIRVAIIRRRYLNKLLGKSNCFGS